MEYKHLNTDEITHNILFLDFDGVCNSYECGSYVTSNSKTYGIDEKIMPRLKEICVKGNAKIVISSNWRRYGENDSIMVDREIFKNPLPKLEKFVGEDIDRLGYKRIETIDGRVTFEGDISVYRCSYGIVECVGKIIFADEKPLCQRVNVDLFGQILVQIFHDLQPPPVFRHAGAGEIGGTVFHAAAQFHQ